MADTITSEKLSIREAADFLLSHDNYLILSHASPDGDTLGCAFGLCSALQSIGKNAKNICADPITAHYDFMKKAVREQDFEPETVISVDIADKKLLGELEAPWADKTVLAIDHHGSHVDFAKKLLLEPEIAACAQTVYKVIVEMGVKLTSDMAACLYTGIATDTGCFKFSNVTPETHMIAAELLKYGFDHSAINYVFFDLRSKARLELEKKIYGGIEYFCGGKCAVVTLDAEALASVTDEDVNGISAIPRQIEGVEVGIVLKQKKKSWKASLRSNSYVNVQEICGIFGGGGHKRAAGCSFAGNNVAEAKTRLIAEIEKVLR